MFTNKETVINLVNTTLNLGLHKKTSSRRFNESKNQKVRKYTQLINSSIFLKNRKLDMQVLMLFIEYPNRINRS